MRLKTPLIVLLAVLGVAALRPTAVTLAAAPPTSTPSAAAPTQVPGTPPARPRTHVEGPHVQASGDDWIVRWVVDGHVREDRIPKATATEVPAWAGAPAIPAELLASVEPGPAVHAAPERILAVGDVHGRFASFLRVLHSAGVIDDAGSWTFGADHLVCCGDLMDRDRDVVGLLWFLRRLEVEAARAGGAVHVILGNHEQLALQGDERYVHRDLLAASARLGIPYADLFGAGTVLGDWLRSKHAIVRIGDVAFVHGGISGPLLALAGQQELDVDGINTLVRRHLGVSRAERRADPVLEGLFGSAGPLWHRGYFRAEEQYHPTSSDELDQALAWLGARRIVVGHTEFDRVGSHMGGRVIACDVNLDRTPEAILIAGDELSRIHADREPEPLTPLAIDRPDSGT